MTDLELRLLFDECAPALVLFARQWCDCPEDAVQEAFIDLSQLRGMPQCPKAWLYTTTRRKAQNFHRSESRRKKHHLKAGEQMSSDPRSGTVDPSQAWFTSSRSSAVLAEDVQAGLATLPIEQREIIVAKVWGEMNLEQLAELLGGSVSSAHRRYASALAALKLSIEDANAPKDFVAKSSAATASETKRTGHSLRTPSGERT